MARGMSSNTAQKVPAAQLSPRKKSGRSQSPRAMERRRLQNRIAQRNHRRRLKEGTCTEEERGSRSPPGNDAAGRQRSARLGTPLPDDSPPHHHHHHQQQQQQQQHQQPSPSSHTQSPSPILAPPELDHMGVHPHEAMMKQVAAPDGMPWNFDFMMAGHMAGGGSGGGGDAFGSPPPPSPFFFPGVQQACSCNGLTGPCARHMEEMRHRFMNLETGPVSPFLSPPPHADAGPGPSPMPMDPSPMMLQSMSSYEDLAGHVPPSIPPPPPPQQQQQRIPNYHPSPKSRYVVDPWPGSDGSGSSHAAPSSSTGRHSSNAGLSSSPQCLGSDGGFLAGLVGNATAAAATATEASSAMSSSTSSVATDTARFNTILEVARNAGFADFDRMATAYYTAHFEKGSRPDLSQRASRSRRLGHVLGDLHAASAGWNAWEARGLRDGVAACARSMYAAEMDKITPFHPPNLHPGEVEMAGLGLASPLLALPDHMETVVQSESPYLWSLLTELAGPQGLYCDRVAQSALALLLHARRNQA